MTVTFIASAILRLSIQTENSVGLEKRKELRLSRVLLQVPV